MNYIAFVTGLIAVTFYFLGYLQKKRRNIIILNATSRILYIIQYIMLSAFEGAVLDIAGVISSFLAQKRLSINQKKIKVVFLSVQIF